jgi:DNA-binding transcriptional MerR regulator
MARTGKYTAEQLAELAGMPLRTVRYYVQEELIEAPLGLGRGSHFDDKHLDQLKRIKLLQASGFDLKAIRERGGDVEKILSGLHTDFLQHSEKLRTFLRGRALRPGELDPDTAIRVPMAEGVELLVDPDIDMPSPKDLVEIALLIRKRFGHKE